MMMFRPLFGQFDNIAAYSVGVVIGGAITDYNRGVLRANHNLIFTVPKEHLANKLEILHEDAVTNKLQYCNIVAYRDLCIELHNLFLVASRDRYEIMLDKKLTDYEMKWSSESEKEMYEYTNTLEINDLAARNNTIFTMQMCRRAMLRNGFYMMWFNTFIGRFRTFIGL